MATEEDDVTKWARAANRRRWALDATGVDQLITRVGRRLPAMSAEQRDRLTALVQESRARQGLPPRVEDPAVLATAAALVRNPDGSR